MTGAPVVVSDEGLNGIHVVHANSKLDPAVKAADHSEISGKDIRALDAVPVDKLPAPLQQHPAIPLQPPLPGGMEAPPLYFTTAAANGFPMQYFFDYNAGNGYPGNPEMPIEQWEDYFRFMSVDGIEAPFQAMYNGDPSMFVHPSPSYGYVSPPPFNPYAPGSSPSMVMNMNGALFPPQAFPYAAAGQMFAAGPHVQPGPGAGQFLPPLAGIDGAPTGIGQPGAFQFFDQMQMVNGAPLQPLAAPFVPMASQQPPLGHQHRQPVVSSPPPSMGHGRGNGNMVSIPRIITPQHPNAARGRGNVNSASLIGGMGSVGSGSTNKSLQDVRNAPLPTGFPPGRTWGIGGGMADWAKQKGKGWAQVVSGSNGLNDAANEQNRGPRTTRGRGQRMVGSLVGVSTSFPPLGSNINGPIPGSGVLGGGGSSLPIGKQQGASGISREEYNKSDFPVKYEMAKFFVIKSYSEDDVHKSIKYNVWASTPNGNRRLDAAYHDAQAKGASSASGAGCPMFLFFSVNASGQFCGIAEMMGPVDFGKSVDFWQQDKWNGQFPVNWRIIKDVPNSQLRHILLPSNEGKPVTNSRDTQEVEMQQGLEMLRIFKSYSAKTSILDDFGFYDSRQKALQEKKAQLQQQQQHLVQQRQGRLQTKQAMAGKDGQMVVGHPMPLSDSAADLRSSITSDGIASSRAAIGGLGGTGGAAAVTGPPSSPMLSVSQMQQPSSSSLNSSSSSSPSLAQDEVTSGMSVGNKGGGSAGDKGAGSGTTSSDEAK
eukprot:TRINITY_DN5668_c0_g1_i6.p1 TRINITY_DN5668_c0_g1~~TRINITY_DN5668_c0_g1_i6.p1  ORF type:complete len:763 (-),score=182.53 TRINITY_DN5668_c0_g1_i6:185-2473(-)